ncbi:hypothetical protein QYF61_017598 [Mycteria americana]|uniref:Uncharacterized protein n=1 Tax=Mycteria americana TaxID=33587 RepID=A0AAN7MWT4_MYCAM|nr:hypothetical protein QYF61_017598 [Mycteria americana]
MKYIYKFMKEFKSRIIDWVGLAGTFKGHLVQPPCNEQGHLHLDQVAQSPVQPGLERFQGWGISHLSGQPGPVFHHPQHKTCLPYAPFKDRKAARRSPRSRLFSRLNNPNSLSLSYQERCSIPLIIFVALLWTRSHRSMSFLC